MKTIQELVLGVANVQIVGSNGAEVSSLTFDSRNVAEGGCFFAVAGTTVDGHDFIDKAIEAGASVVVCNHIPQGCEGRCTFVVCDDTAETMAAMASTFYDHPSQKLKVVGVTGTNGKTTIATLLYRLVRQLGYKAGLISTVVYRINDREIASTHTTPDVLRLNAMMAEMVDCGCDYCFMECSSHAIVQRRTAGIRFAGGLFTNLTHDHLDYHGTFLEYLRAKKMFFDELPREAFAIVNADDRNGEVMLQNTAARKMTLSLQQTADFMCKVLEMTPEGMLLRIDGNELWVRFIGRFNASNLLTVYAAALCLGFDCGEVLACLSSLTPVEGRMETVRANDGTTAIIDYAHTPDALKKTIAAIRETCNRGRRLIVVCGCGGDRDRTKRPEMAEVAVSGADVAIFTSDNPRSEQPEAILRDMEAGVSAGDNYLKIVDRGEAIRTAIMVANAGDTILVAGKGHENYQIVGKERLHFSDRETVEQIFNQFKR